MNQFNVPPIVLWSNETTYETARFALFHGIVDYVKKDTSVEEWLEVFHHASSKIRRETKDGIKTYPLFPFDEIPIIARQICLLQKEGLAHLMQILHYSFTLLPINNMAICYKLEQFIVQISDIIYDRYPWLDSFYPQKTLHMMPYYNSENPLSVAKTIEEFFQDFIRS